MSQRPDDDLGDTQMFRAFVDRPPEQPRPRAAGVPFRLLTLLAGLVVFALVVMLLFKL